MEARRGHRRAQAAQQRERIEVDRHGLSLPFELRALAAFKPEVLRAMARLFVESIFGLYQRRARRDGLMGSECGAVTLVLRFGGSLNLNVHMHVVVLDGVFVRDLDHAIVFHAAPRRAAIAIASR